VDQIWIMHSKNSLVIRTNIIAIVFCLVWISCTEKSNTAYLESSTIESKEKLPIVADTFTKIAVQKEDVKIEYDTSLWTEVIQLDNRLKLDLRYATNNNFVEEKMYDCARCFLRPEAAEALKKVHTQLISKGYYLKLLDCYRPKSVQEKLWAKVPNATYVTPPHKGSMHNRGFAVDVTLVNSVGEELDMGSPFDFFGRAAHHDNYNLETEILERRKLLKESMAAFDFKHIRTEWWHYSYQGPFKSPFILADYQWTCH